jgi:hypothetical protein
MPMMTLKCPECGAEAKLSLTDTSYTGPRRCWKCHEFFTITIHNNQLTSCEPLSKEDYERQQEAKKAAEKMGGGIGFSRQEQPKFPQKAAEKPRGGIDFSRQGELDLFQKAAETSRGGIDFVKRDEPPTPQKPPDKPRDFTIPLSPQKPSFKTEPEIPAIFPPERYNTFVPLENIKEEPEKPQKPKKSSSQAENDIPAIFPPDRIQTFVPLEDTNRE